MSRYANCTFHALMTLKVRQRLSNSKYLRRYSPALRAPPLCVVLDTAVVGTPVISRARLALAFIFWPSKVTAAAGSLILPARGCYHELWYRYQLTSTSSTTFRATAWGWANVCAMLLMGLLSDPSLCALTQMVRLCPSICSPIRLCCGPPIVPQSG